MNLSFDESPQLDLDVSATEQIPPPSRLDKEVAAYASILHSNDPLQQYKTIVSDLEYQGKSDNLSSILSRLKDEEDLETKKVMVNIIQNPEISKEEKYGALKYYEQTSQAMPSLKERFSQQMAATNENIPVDAEAFTRGFLEKEQSISEIQQTINSDAANRDDNMLLAFGGLMLEVLPFVQAGYKGYQYSEMLKAVTGEDYNVLQMAANSVLQGSAVEDIQKAIAAIPTTEGKKKAVRRLLDIVAETPGTDFNRYSAVVATLEDPQADWQKIVLNVFGILGVGGVVVGATRMLPKAVKLTPSVNPDSVLGRAAAHNPPVASGMAGQAVVDESGELSAALGTKASEIVSDILPHVDDEVRHAMNVEGTAVFKEILEPLDEAAKGSLKATERSAILYPEELADALSTTIKNTVAAAKGAAVHLGKSTFNVTPNNISGTAVFGKTDSAPFQSYTEALEAARLLAPELPEGAVSVVKKGRGGVLRPAYSTTDKGEHYLQFKYSKDITAQDIVLFGPDAVRVKFDLFGREFKPVSDVLTRVALSGGKVGQWLFAHHIMPDQAASAAFVAFDKALAVEEPFLAYARKFVSQQSADNRRVVAELLEEGEQFSEGGQLGKVFTYDEVIQRGIAKGLAHSEAEEAAKGYYVYRRLADWMYTMSDRAKSKQLAADGYKWIEGTDGLRFVGKPVTLNEVSDIRAIINKSTGGVEPITKDAIEQLYAEGNSLVRMAYNFKEGDTIVRYSKMSKGFKLADIDGGTLPYIRGYVPRGYDNYYFVTRTPNRVNIDGRESLEKEVRENNRTTVHAADSKQEADAIVARLQAEDQDGLYEVKRDRLSERSVLEEADVFRQNMIHSSRRGKQALEGGNQKDPLVGMMSLIQSLSKKAALEDFLTASKTDFVRQYGDFLVEKGRFPTSVDKIISKKNMTVAESDSLKRAKSVYNWLEGLMVMQRFDSALYKDVMYGAGEFAEKFAPVLGKLLRALGEHYPVDYLRKISTALFIAMRPLKQVLLQPSQLMLYTAIEPSLVKPNEAFKFFSNIAALRMVKYYENIGYAGSMVPDKAVVAVVAKSFGVSNEEAVSLIKRFKGTGLLQSVDSNLLIDGMYSQRHKKLIETGMETASRRAGATIKAIPEAARTVGFNVGEEVNLAGSWLIAEKRFARLNPNVDLSSPYAVDRIAADARELAFSMTRPGAFQYQKNAFALPLQFIAAPHKALLSLFTSKMLSSQEKARLMASHFVFYGAAGVGLSNFVLGEGGLNLRGKYGADVPEDIWLAVNGGVVDWGANTLIRHLMDTGEEKTGLAISSSFSPLSGGIIPFGDFLDSLNEDPIATTLLGPSWNIVDPQKGRITTAIRDISSMMRGDMDTKANFKMIAMRAAELSSGGTDWMKYRMARNLDLTVAANGYVLDDKATAAEAIGAALGIQTIRADAYYKQLKRLSSEEKEAKAAVKYIYDGFVKQSQVYGTNPEPWRDFNLKVQSWLSLEKDESLKKTMQQEFRKLSKQQATTTGQSLSERVYYSAQTASQEDLENTFNIMKSYGLEEQAATIKNLMGEE